jgi:hypothetical protein
LAAKQYTYTTNISDIMNYTNAVADSLVTVNQADPGVSISANVSTYILPNVASNVTCFVNTSYDHWAAKSMGNSMTKYGSAYEILAFTAPTTHQIKASFVDNLNPGQYWINCTANDGSLVFTGIDPNYTTPTTSTLYLRKLFNMTASFGYVLPTGPYTSTGDYANVTVTDLDAANWTCQGIQLGATHYSNVVFSTTNQTNRFAFNWTDGANQFRLNCSDAFGNYVNATNDTSVYAKKIDLIEEQTGNTFSDFAHMTTLRLVDESNSTVYDFLAGSATSVYLITATSSDHFRLEKTYITANSTVLWVDLIADEMPSDTRVCVANNTLFFQNIFYSNQIKAIALKNNLANCYLMIGATQYAYSGALMDQAQTIAAGYSLYSVDVTSIPPTFSFLVAVDGGQAQAHNIDILQFNQNQPSYSLTSDNFGYDFPDANSIRIWYTNQNNNNTATNILIKNATGYPMFNYTETLFPNNFTVTFNKNSAGPYGNWTLGNGQLTLDIIKQTIGGGIATITRTIQIGVTYIFNSGVAMIISVALIFFGLLFVSTKLAFGWFGIFIEVAAFTVTLLAPATIYLRLLQAVIIIMAFFTILIYKDEYSKVT